MWIIPSVGGTKQCPAVNIATARQLLVLPARNDKDHYYVTAIFANGMSEGLVLMDVAGPQGDPMGRDQAQKVMDYILEEVAKGTKVLDLTQY